MSRTYTVHIERLNPHEGNTVVEDGRTGTRYRHKDAVYIDAESEAAAVREALRQASARRWDRRYGRSR